MDGDDLRGIRIFRCRKRHFARECRSGRSQGRRSYGDNGRSNAPTNESSSQALWLHRWFLGGYDWSNDFDVEPVNYALMAISSSSSSSSSDSEVQKCSKQCLESFKVSSDEEPTLANDRSSKADRLRTNDTNTKSPKSVSESSVLSNPKINKDSVIIEDWTSDDEEEMFGVQKVRPDNQTKEQLVNTGKKQQSLVQDHAVEDSDHQGKIKDLLRIHTAFTTNAHRTRNPVKDVIQVAQDKPSENASPARIYRFEENKGGRCLMIKEGQHRMPEDKQVLHDELEMMVTQELAAKAGGGEGGGGGKILLNASTLPNADLPIDLNMPALEDASDTLPNDGIFNGAYDDDEDVGAEANFSNMDNTIAVSPIPTLRIHKDHPKGQILGILH
ncbi:hypothetical protein Tco_1312614 [Tanacetum coccineum]